MKKSTRRILLILVVLALLYGTMRLYFNATDDFRLSNITYNMPYQKEWEVAHLDSKQEQQLPTILSQQFAYLGKGAQSYAFASDDGKFVIKFFKFKHLRPSLFHDLLPTVGFIKDFKEKQVARKKRKLYGVFQGYKTAYEMHKKESGLLFVQLNITGNPSRTVTVRDKIGLKRTIDLSNIPFILQERGVTLRVVLKELLDKGDIASAEDRIGSIFDLYASEYKKGIYDHDHGVMYNTGFVGLHPIHLDVGKLVKEESMRNSEIAKGDLLLVAAKMKIWTLNLYPQYFQHLSNYIDNKIEQM
ncbi:MAG: hypothetical protein H0X29_05210 [Parachlamydiaceae bacterium]|nr:hypothetical protein [Parachlamydiaceae bacterium]